MSADADFYFVGIRRAKSKGDKRIDGYFIIPRLEFMCRACSGSRSLYPIPTGRFVASHFRERSTAAMVRDGVGFSVDLSDKWDPALKRKRSLLRIHPDGNLPGSAGCVAILNHVKTCRDHLQTMLEGRTRSLNVITAETPADMALCTAYGCFIFA